MTPDPTKRETVGAPYPEEYGAPVPLSPPLYRDMLDAEALIQSAQSEIDAHTDAVLKEAEAAIDGAQRELDITLAAKIGEVENALNAASAPVEKAMTQVADTTFRALISAQADMAQTGLGVPYHPDHEVLDLADDTGEAVFNRLAGVVKEAPAPTPRLTPGVCVPGLYDSRTPEGAAAIDAAIRTVGSIVTTLDDVNFRVECPQVAPPEDTRVTTVSDPDVPPTDVISPPVPPVPPVPPEPEPHCDCPPPSPPVVSCPAPVVYCSPAPLPPEPEPVKRDLPHPPPDLPPGPGTDALIKTEGFGVVWSAANVCQLVDAAEHKPLLEPAPGEVRPLAGNEVTSEDSLVGALYKRAINAVRGFAGAASEADWKPALIGEAAQWLIGSVAIEPIWSTLDPLSVPDRAASSRLAVKVGLANEIQRRTGVPLDYLMQTEQYLLQYSAPQFIPSQAELNLDYLHDEITGDQWSCLTRANGNVVACQEWTLNSVQTRPNVSEVVNLWRRGKIKDPELHDRFRELGVLDKLYEDNFVALSQWIPTPPDVVRFMVRDVFDPAVVFQYDLDKDFLQKFPALEQDGSEGKARQWCRAFGIGEDEMRYFWRAHWVLPSNTQLYQMLHRLREDRPEYVEWNLARLRAEDEQLYRLTHPEPPVVNLDIAKRALEVNDTAPYWVDKLLAVSYNPITRSDLLAAYMQDAIGIPELLSRLQDTGLNKADAQRVIDIQATIKARRVSNLTGVWTIRKVVSAYKSGAINAFKFDQLLAPLVPDAAERKAIGRATVAEIESDTNRLQLAALRRKYLLGMIGSNALFPLLNAITGDVQQDGLLHDRWDAELAGKWKEVSAGMISTWIGRGLIEADDAQTRLQNIGYTVEDARRIIQAAIMQGMERIESRNRAARGEMRAVIRDQRTAARTARQDLEQRQKDLEKQIKDAQKESERIGKALGQPTGGKK